MLRFCQSEALEGTNGMVVVRIQSSKPDCRNLARISSIASTFCVVCISLFAGHAVWGAIEPVPLSERVRVPPGFKATAYADDSLAHDIYSMTTDSLGRIVVSGAGYVRILIDRDGDGKADSFKQFADGPASGAQGMFFHGRDLLCIGDEGLLRYRDRNGDDRADGEPDVFLKLKTGSEHHSHAIRRGPDGWWYVIAGNHAGIDHHYVTLPTSPIKNPEAGVIFRLKPDLTGAEVITHGYRNAYDFDFHYSGDIFTFDSDGEREVSLPWYQPTRVFQAVTATHAGWFSRSWKRPDDALGMPPVVGRFGRGSPTGVVTYRHHQFPAQFRDALFILDWTFGRVIAVPLAPEGSVWSGEPIPFMTGRDQFGFAPTDAVVGPDGSLFISVGGRGTQGGVHRIHYEEAEDKSESTDGMNRVLDAPQPLDSWSRGRWMPVARLLGKDEFLKAALNTQLNAAQRIRAIEVLTELFGGVDSRSLKTFAVDPEPLVRARAVWSYGRTALPRPDLAALKPFLTDRNPIVVRYAYEMLIGASPDIDWDVIHAEMNLGIRHPDRFVRHAVAHVLPHLTDKQIARLFEANETKPRAVLTLSQALISRNEKTRSAAIEVGFRLLEMKDTSPAVTEIKLDAVRLIQIGLGDVGPSDQVSAPAFEAYTAREDLAPRERELDLLRIRLNKLYPSSSRSLDYELERLIAMLAPYNDTLLDTLLSQITADSSPVDDLHHLLVIARLKIQRSQPQTEAIAKALIDLDAKIITRQLKIDTNWDDRVTELYAELVAVDPVLPQALLAVPGFGRTNHVLFLSQLEGQFLQTAVDAFVAKFKQNPNYELTNDVVFVMGESKKESDRQLVRKQFDNLAVRNAVLMVVADNPQPSDRAMLIEGMGSAPIEVLEKIVTGLTKLSAAEGADAGRQAVALVRTLRKLGAEKREFKLREAVVRLLRRDTSQQLGFVFGEAGYAPQREAVLKWDRWAAEKYPDVYPENKSADVKFEEWTQRLAGLEWDEGDVSRGRTAYEKFSCNRCHGGRQAMGPDLAGVAKRFSREDFFTAVLDPNRDVSPRYQTTMIESRDGKIYVGLIVYTSVDGVILRTALGQAFRLESYEMEAQHKLPTSMMPSGLLNYATDQELVDFYAYVRSLGKAD